MSGTTTQHVINVAGHAIELHHLRHGAHLAGEPVEPLLRVVPGFDRDEDRHAEPELFLIDQRDALLDHTLDSRRWMRFQHGVDEPDEIADLGDGAGGILLHEGEDLAIDGVHGDLLDGK